MVQGQTPGKAEFPLQFLPDPCSQCGGQVEGWDVLGRALPSPKKSPDSQEQGGPKASGRGTADSPWCGNYVNYPTLGDDRGYDGSGAGVGWGWSFTLKDLNGREGSWSCLKDLQGCCRGVLPSAAPPSAGTLLGPGWTISGAWEVESPT